MKLWFQFLCGVLLLAWCGPLAAAPEFRVQIVAAGPGETLTALEQRTRELLRPRALQVAWQVTARFRPRDVFEASSGAALARIWLDARDVTRAVIYLVDDAHERFLVRVVPLEAGYDEVACESVGTIIESSLDALIEGVALGVDRQSAEEQLSVLEQPAPAAQTAPAEAPRSKEVTTLPLRETTELRVALELAYRLQLLSSTPVFLHGPELGFSLGGEWRGVTAFGFVQLGYRLPTRWEQDGIGVKLQGAALRAGPGVRWALSSRFSLAALGLLGLDWLRATPTAQPGSAEARDTLSVLAPTLGLALDADYRLLRGLSAALALGFDADLLGNHFDVLSNGRAEKVLDPWRFQPFARLALRTTW